MDRLKAKDTAPYEHHRKLGFHVCQRVGLDVCGLLFHPYRFQLVSADTESGGTASFSPQCVMAGLGLKECKIPISHCFHTVCSKSHIHHLICTKMDIKDFFFSF